MWDDRKIIDGKFEWPPEALLDYLGNSEIIEGEFYRLSYIALFQMRDHRDFIEALSEVKRKRTGTSIPLRDVTTPQNEPSSVSVCLSSKAAADASLNPTPYTGEEEKLPLPIGMNTGDAQKYFKKAIEKGIMKYEYGKYEWKGIPGMQGSYSQLAYFCGKVYGYVYGNVNKDAGGNPCYGNIGTSLPIDDMESLFGRHKWNDCLKQVYSAKKAQKWRAPIDELFE